MTGSARPVHSGTSAWPRLLPGPLRDHIGEARELHALGVIDLRPGRYEEATGHVRRSLALFRDAGCRPGEAFALGYLGELELRQDRYVQAAVHLRRSLGLGREIGSRLCQARALAGLGVRELRQGRHVQAAGHFRQSLGLHREAAATMIAVNWPRTGHGPRFVTGPAELASRPRQKT
ncbi:MAG TPA: tetratricopeptide repeat protein [Streptosporangiaceae bacterium]|nr:tetratricopeptide repeat protein [Streptosporangiaceae bacterium]